jgi:hypothetical protein
MEIQKYINDKIFFEDFYTGIINGFHGNDVQNRVGSRPRGAFTKGKPGELYLMIVLQNPGESLEIEYDIELGCRDSKELAKKLWYLCGEVFDGIYYSKTLSIARREMAFILDCSPEQVLDYVMFTNLVRCTPIKGSTPSAKTFEIGLRYLEQEISLWKPRYIITYGKYAYRMLEKAGLNVSYSLPHPAALGKWLKANNRIIELREAKRILDYQANRNNIL